MEFTTRNRYGYKETYNTTELNEIKTALTYLFTSLRTEEFEEPDDEHAIVSLKNGDLYIEISVFGRVVLGDTSWITTKENTDRKDAKFMQEDLYMRDIEDNRLLEILTALALGEFESVFSYDWVTRDQLAPYEKDFYRN